MMENQTTKTSASLLGDLSVEILMKILDSLSNKDKFTMCQVSSRFNTLVHSCTRWDLDLGEDSSGKLARFSITVKIIKNLKLIYRSYFSPRQEVRHGGLTEEDFFAFFKMHPEVEYLYLNTINSETLSYIAHFCTGLKRLDSNLYSKVSSEFKLGFGNLETLDLSVDVHPDSYKADKTEKDAHYLQAYVACKNIASLSKLRILKLNVGYTEEGEQFLEQWPQMELLQSLEIDISSESITSKMVRSCSTNLSNVFVEIISSEDLHILVNNCPNLTSVGIKCSEISHEGFAALFSKLGKQLQYLHLAETNLNEQDMKALIHADATQLKALDLDFDDNHHVRSEVFVNLIQKYGGQLDRLNIWGNEGLNDAVLYAVIDKCPSIVEQGVWKIDWWNITGTGLSKLISECRSSIRTVIMPNRLGRVNLLAFFGQSIIPT